MHPKMMSGLQLGAGWTPQTFYSEPRLIGAFARSGFDRKWYPVVKCSSYNKSITWQSFVRLGHAFHLLKEAALALMALCSLVGLPETQGRKIVNPKSTFGGPSASGLPNGTI